MVCHLIGGTHRLLGLAVALAVTVLFVAPPTDGKGKGFGSDHKLTTASITDPEFVVRVSGGEFLVADAHRVLKFAKTGATVKRFGVDGTVEVAAGDEAIRDLQASPDGGFVALTAAGDKLPGVTDISVKSFTSDGSPNLGFAGDGTLETGLSGSRGYEPQLAVDTAGRVVIGASETVARWRADGTPDPTFGGSGSVSLDGVQVGGDLRFDWLGRIVTFATAAPGTATSLDSRILRLLDSGQLDPSFGANGAAMLLANASYHFLALGGPAYRIFAGSRQCPLDDLRCAQGTLSLQGTGAGRPQFGGDGSISWPYVGIVLDQKGHLVLAGTADKHLGAAAAEPQSFYLVRLTGLGEQRGALRFINFGRHRDAEMTAVSQPRNGKVIAVGRVDGDSTRTGIAVFSLN
jgi:hypothetical protein